MLNEYKLLSSQILLLYSPEKHNLLLFADGKDILNIFLEATKKNFNTFKTLNRNSNIK